jgi:hypothetical protein
MGPKLQLTQIMYGAHEPSPRFQALSKYAVEGHFVFGEYHDRKLGQHERWRSSVGYDLPLCPAQRKLSQRAHQIFESEPQVFRYREALHAFRFMVASIKAHSFVTGTRRVQAA